MATINFTSALKRFYPDIKSVKMDAKTVADVLQNLDKTYKGMTDFLIDEHGILRDHINIFIGDKLIVDREKLSDNIQENDEILIFQALSGG
jgi:sulfur-carrier protein